MTVMVSLVFIYLFALFGWSFLSETFFSTLWIPNGENTCTSLLQCFSTVLALGPRSSGSVGDIFLRVSYEPDVRAIYLLRWFFDVLAFIIINLCGLKLIFGIIIDTFARKLRVDESCETSGRKLTRI
jgi:hypothetical protein